MADSKRENDAEILDVEYNRMRKKFFTKFSNGEIHPENEDVRNKVRISVYPNASEADHRVFSGYSGNTNLVEAQKEATIQAFKHMGLDIEPPFTAGK
jgi:hypothetical protein